MSSTIEQIFSDAAVAAAPALNEGMPPFACRLRGVAAATLSGVRLPDKSVERYKYSDIRARYKAMSETSDIVPPCECASPRRDDFPIKEAYRIDITNGYSTGDSQLTILENGITYGSLRDATATFVDLVEKYSDNNPTEATDATALLNTAFASDGAFIYVPRNLIIETPFVIKNQLCTDRSGFVYNRLLVIVEKGSQATVIIDNTSSADSAQVIDNRCAQIFAERGAMLKIIDLQRSQAASTTVTNTEISQQADSNVRVVTVTIGGGFVRNNLSVKFLEKGAEHHCYGLAIAGGAEHVDNSTRIEHVVPDCTSFEKYKNIASGEATTAFNGMILVDKDAQHTAAFQENHNLQLSDTAHIYTRPQLEIYADDVKCSHGATVGRLDADAIYYMRQRGISETDAKKLQMYGFLNDIVEHIGIEPLEHFVSRHAMEKIEKL